MAFPTPHFAVLLRSREEFDLFIQMKRQQALKRVGSCVVRLFDAPLMVIPRIQELQQTTIHGTYLDTGFRSLARNALVFVDPATEYLFYENSLQEFASSITMPKALREYALSCARQKEKLPPDEYAKWKAAFHRKFWTEMYEDPKRRIQLVAETLDLELKSIAKVTMAPGPLIDSQQLFATAVKMNDVTRQLSRTKAAEPSTYLLFHKRALSDDRLMDDVISYIEKDDSPLTILKFKGLDLTESERINEREAYKELLLQLSLIRQKNPTRGFALFEAENQTFPSATVAFDLVSTSYTGQDTDVGFGKAAPYGKWYDPKEMIQRDFGQVQRLMRTNGLLPHGCPVCRGITSLGAITADGWYSDRRTHYCFCMQEFMEIISRAIKENNVELAREKIVNSSIAVLRSLIPRA